MLLLIFGRKKWVKSIKIHIFRTSCRNGSKMAKKSTNITTVFRVWKHMIFSVFIIFPVFLIYEIIRKIPTLLFFAFFDILETVVILCTQNGHFCDFTHIWPKFEHWNKSNIIYQTWKNKNLVHELSKTLKLFTCKCYPPHLVAPQT